MKNAAIRIRPISLKDADLVKSLRLRALADAPYAFEESLEKARAMPEAAWQRRLQANVAGEESFCALAFDGDSAVGMAVGFFEQSGSKHACVAALWVAPEHRRSGLATALLGAVERWARAAGAVFLRAQVKAGNPIARRFFEAAAFRPVEGREPAGPILVEREIATG
ncbi:MAG: GNAT family N-acetyltransferase [Deltaproteobacteria bacterium]|nr:GNAT family N-acetyltransferase [Deltaproteobacteria bacterium]